MITYQIVNRKHAICNAKCPDTIDRRIHKWWKSMKLYSTNYAILAFDGDTLIGFLRFVKRKHKKEGRLLLADGTYVLAAYRNQKIAKKLWTKAIRFVKPDYIEVTTVSRGGARLIASMVQKYHKPSWYIIRGSNQRR